MKNNHTDISGNIVVLNLQDLQETANVAVGSLANQAIKYAEQIREELNKTLYPKGERPESFQISTKLKAEYLERTVSALIIATRTLDAVYAAENREEVVVIKSV